MKASTEGHPPAMEVNSGPTSSGVIRTNSKRKAFWGAFTLLSLALLQQNVCADVSPPITQHENTMSGTSANAKHATSAPEEVATETTDVENHQLPVLRDLDPSGREQLPISAPTSRPGEKSKHEILIVSAVDGSLAGISKTTGELLWKRRGGNSASSSQGKEKSSEAPPLLEPLVSTSTTIQSNSKMRSEDDWRTTAVPSIDGSVHLTAKTSTRGKGSRGLEDDNGQVTLTTSLSELAKRAPFVDNRGRVYTSQQRSVTFAIDGESGEILQQIPSASKSSSDWSQHSGQSAWKDRLVVWLGRTDRTVLIHEPRSGALDVKVGAAQILSINEMVVAKALGEESDETPSASRRSSLLLEGAAPSTRSGSLVATPGGHLAWRDYDSGTIIWVAKERFSVPVVYGIDAQSGDSIIVDLVPDAAMSQGSEEYLSKELLRQYNLLKSDSGSLDGSGNLIPEEHTIVGSLPNGQLYALPFGGKRHGFHHVPTTQSLPAAAASTAEMRAGSTVSSGGHSRLPHHSSYQHTGDRKGGKPLLKRNCQPGSPQYPSCLVMGRHESLESFAQNGGHSLVEAVLRFDEDKDNAVVPYFHPEHDHTPPHKYYFVTDEERNRRKFQRFIRVMGSWLAPVIALIFVLSFEMGRRKRQQEKDKLDDKTADISSVQPVTAAPVENGIIQVFDDVILGYGGHGTVVFKGLLEGRQVAVKRMLKAYHGNADREISLLIESDGHPNVVRYFLKEVRGDFVYLALELCDLSLHELIGQVRGITESPLSEKDRLLSAVPDATKGILFQIAQGVKHLHGLRIVHRDLKPANILLADGRKSKKASSKNTSVCDIFINGHYVAKISDMGLGKQIIGQSSYGGSTFGDASLRGQSNGGQSSIAGAGPGSVGWQAPEVMALRMPSDVSTRSEDSNHVTDSIAEASPIDIAAQSRTSRSVDIFSLGCIFYATLVPASHPFGEWYEREANIMHNRPNMEVLKTQSPDAFDLVASMIQRVPSDRPTARQICEHPYFWSADRRLAFLCDVSDRIESEGTTTDGSLPQSFIAKLLAVERRASEVVGTAWDLVLDEALVSNVQRFRTYDPSSVRDLLRLIRNKHHHYDELPETLKAKMGSNTAGLLGYFESKFPSLIIHCYNAFRALLSEKDPLSIKYSIIPVTRRASTKFSDSAVSTIPEVPPGPLTETADATPDDVCEIVDEAPNYIDTPTEPEHEMITQHTGDPDGVTDGIAVGDGTPSNDPLQSVTPEPTDPPPLAVTEPLKPDEGTPVDIVVWECSAAAKTFQNRGWSRADEEWIRRTDATLLKPNSNLVRCAEDPKFRTRLCNHWDVSLGTFCPMRKKNKCVFAHGPVELRVKEGKRNRWGKLVDKNGDNKNPNHSGGEDTYGAARSIEVERRQEGKWNVNGTGKGKKNTPRKKDSSSGVGQQNTQG
eukprot:scaffold4244_cov167-Amphora_coffeaeformis.AAC.19